jgi:hypothetical protein
MISALGRAGETVVVIHAANCVDAAQAIVAVGDTEGDSADPAADRRWAEIVYAGGDGGIVS